MWENIVNVAHSQRRTFKNHFLHSVHCELGLSGIAVEAIFAKESYFKDAFKAIGFLESSKIVRGHYVFNSPDAAQESALHQSTSTEAIGLRFVSQKPRREVNITCHNIVVSDFSYEGFESFSKQLKSYASIVKELLGSEWSINKTGFRKINSIIIEQVKSYPEAYEIFNPVLFGSLRAGLAHFDALKISEEVLILEKQGKLCVLRNGLKATDHPDTYEATLDFDLVDNNKYSIDQIFADILPTLNELHFDLFIWAITDALIQTMEA
jgi:uncharacterized protein (TIGR04255 family)